MGSLSERSMSRNERLVAAAKSGDWQQTIALLRNIPQQFPLGKNGESALQEMVSSFIFFIFSFLFSSFFYMLAANYCVA